MNTVRLAAGACLLLSVACFVRCTRDADKDLAPATLKSTLPRAAVPQSSFSLWGTCDGHPYDISGTDGICVPVGDCSTDIDAAQQNGGQSATGFQFNGCFKGGSNANSSASEEAVFLADNVSQWNGDEMGFVKTLNDNALKAYVQGGGNYYTYLISVGDNGYHTFKAQARSSNHSMVDFYVDGNYVCTLTNNSGSYYGNWFYMVGTNHWYGGSSHSGQQIEMYDMTTY
jgi:hypothetical protein